MSCIDDTDERVSATGERGETGFPKPHKPNNKTPYFLYYKKIEHIYTNTRTHTHTLNFQLIVVYYEAIKRELKQKTYKSVGVMKV